MQAPLVVQTSVGVLEEYALWICMGIGSGILSSSCLAAGCSGSAQTRGLVEALELAQLKVVGPIAYSNHVSGVIDGQKIFSGWNGD